MLRRPEAACHINFAAEDCTWQFRQTPPQHENKVDSQIRSNTYRLDPISARFTVPSSFTPRIWSGILGQQGAISVVPTDIPDSTAFTSTSCRSSLDGSLPSVSVETHRAVPPENAWYWRHCDHGLYIMSLIETRNRFWRRQMSGY